MFDKTTTPLFFFLLITLSSTQGNAHNQAVVIPLSSSSHAVAGYDGGSQYERMSIADTVYRTVTLELPGKGLVIVNASGYFTSSSATDDNARCSITQDTSIEMTHLMVSGFVGTNSVEWAPFGMTRAFPLEAGRHTFNLVCESVQGASPWRNIHIKDSQLNAVFYSMPAITIPAAREINDACSKNPQSCGEKPL